MVYILFYRLPLRADGGKDFYAPKEVLHELTLRRESYDRRRWVVPWIQARHIMKNPKQGCEVSFSFYDEKTGLDLIGVGSPLNKLRAAKAKVTEIQNRLEQARQAASKTLFSVEEYPDYHKFMERLAKYQEKVERLTKEIYG